MHGGPAGRIRAVPFASGSSLESSACCREKAASIPLPCEWGSKLPSPSRGGARTLKMPNPPCTARRAGLPVPCAPAHLFSLLISGCGGEIIT